VIFEVVTHSANMVERKGIIKEYREVEEGERELTGRCRLGRQQRDGVVAGAGSSRSGSGQRRQRVREVVEGCSTLGMRPPGLPLFLNLPFMHLS
jgi:hypothetical protein